ncbi:MAG TPA: hypothetical protein VLW84_07665 [Terriglobales bacterium]|nr:hypothetical protein [Terriglobales bacterium]
MDLQMFSEWLASQTVSERISAIALIYSRLTVYSRELFLPDRTAGKEQRVLEILHGLNETHHTLANWLVAYSTDESKAFPVNALSQQLLDIEKKYRLENFLTAAIDSVRVNGGTSK